MRPPGSGPWSSDQAGRSWSGQGLHLWPLSPGCFLWSVPERRVWGTRAPDTGSAAPQRKCLRLRQPPAPPCATPGFFPDLRWNHIGLLGGRALANCLPSNRTLWRLELAGNSIPSDVLRAVGTGGLHSGAGHSAGPCDGGLATRGGAALGSTRRHFMVGADCPVLLLTPSCHSPLPSRPHLWPQGG